MSQNEKQREIWYQLDQLSSQEIMGIVEATVTVLQAGWGGEENIHKMPSMPLTNMLKEILTQEGVKVNSGQIKMLISDNEVSLNLCRTLLKEIAPFPELANEVENIYFERQKMMGIEPVSWLLAGAIFVLAIKVREIDLKKGRVKFDKLSDKAIEALTKLLKIDIGV